MAITITIANEKGGVGKTTTAVNLAAGLALRLADRQNSSSRVLLVDMDPQVHALLAAAYENHQAVTGDSLAALLIETPPPSIQRMIQRSDHHANLFFVPSERAAMVRAARELPALMANETRLQRALSAVQNDYAYIIIDTPPNTGDLLINALVAANQVIIPVETSYLGVSGLIELQRTIEQVQLHFRPDLKVLGYLPTMVEEQRSETQEILEELKKEYAGRMNVEFIDVWQDEAVGKQYNVDTIPTQIFFDAEGKELFRHTGFFGKEDILAKWQELGVDVGAGKP